MLDLPRDAAGLATDRGAIVADEHCQVLAARLTLCHGSTAAAPPFATRLGDASPSVLSGRASV
jgi:hypothetical protein